VRTTDVSKDHCWLTDVT
jgi:hypothetical protein